MESVVKPRLVDHVAMAPNLFKAMLALEAAIGTCGLEHGLLVLIKLRASQINGCAYCIHMHIADLLASGEEQSRLDLLSAWRETNLYTSRERAALAWTEALTLLADTKAPDADYDILRAEFTPEEQVELTFAIGAINVWNRLQVGFRAQPTMKKVQHAA
jgi:AhpD family alkylhydroperoxidase